MNILFIADIVGNEMIDIILDVLPRLRNQYKLDFIIANAENADRGKGVLPKQVEKLKAGGIHCLTSGNHIWEPRKKEVLVQYAGYLLRPLNYPPGNIGIGSTVISNNGLKLAVLNLQGRSFMYTIDCPFAAAEKEIRRLRSETPFILVDFHAEASAEKQAMGWFLDGKVSAVVGTHTHVQTADERIYRAALLTLPTPECAVPSIRSSVWIFRKQLIASVCNRKFIMSWRRTTYGLTV